MCTRTTTTTEERSKQQQQLCEQISRDRNKRQEERKSSETQLLSSVSISQISISQSLSLGGNMTTSKRLADRKVERFEKNVTRRGAVPETTAKKGSDYPVGPMVLGLFVFVVIGSSLFQIIRTATSGGMA